MFRAGVGEKRREERGHIPGVGRGKVSSPVGPLGPVSTQVTRTRIPVEREARIVSPKYKKFELMPAAESSLIVSLF